MRKYYEAYDDRYRQVHEENLAWFSRCPSAIVAQVISRYELPVEAKMLEIGCGEGRDAKYLLDRGYDLLATDASSEAVDYCRKESPGYAECFQSLDCVKGRLETKYDFIYAVAVIHMLVQDEDRNGFYCFIREQLTENGIGLICTMGDGIMESSSDIQKAFELQRRHHQQSGKELMLAGTSCRVVSFTTFLRELENNGLSALEKGFTSVEPDFPQMMYAVVKRKS